MDLKNPEMGLFLHGYSTASTRSPIQTPFYQILKNYCIDVPLPLGFFILKVCNDPFKITYSNGKSPNHHQNQ